MSSQRRTFLRNIALTSIGLPLFSNHLLASPKGSLNSVAITGGNILPAGRQQPFNIKNPFLGELYYCLARSFSFKKLIT